MKKLMFMLLATLALTGCSGAAKENAEVSGGTSSTPKEVIENHEYVDLGLPSGLKWATCNIGAKKPTDLGDYFAWGETKTKSTYSESTYQHHDGEDYTDIGIDISGTQYDVARKEWGGTWRMPTKNDFVELMKNCDWQWTKLNGTDGYMVVSNTNGNKIFLPFTGYRKDGNSWINLGSEGHYWTASPDSWDSFAQCLLIKPGYINVTTQLRYMAFTVRPVSE